MSQVICLSAANHPNTNESFEQKYPNHSANKICILSQNE